MMPPEQFKSDIQAAYMKAIGNPNRWVEHTDRFYRIFDGLTVLGREAGIDLIHTSRGSILQAAIDAAEAKKHSLTLKPGRVGKAALDGMVEALREMTGLEVAESSGGITLTWASTEPKLV